MAKARLTPLQQRSYDLIAQGYGYIECNPHGHKAHKARQINALISKGLIEAWESGGHTHKNGDTRKLLRGVDDWWVGYACLKGQSEPV
jgi:hypothetical protein